MKHKNLYKKGLWCGLIPLIGGLIIFFTWWVAKDFFAIDLDEFELYGFLWIEISIPFATIGLSLLIYTLIKNYPNFIKQLILGILLVVVNIPIVLLVLDKQSDIERRAYIKFYNKTKQNNLELILKSSGFEKQIGVLDDNEAFIKYYYPKYIYKSDSYYTIDSLTLIVKEKFTTHYLTLPRINQGECKHLYIDKDFKLIEGATKNNVLTNELNTP